MKTPHENLKVAHNRPKPFFYTPAQPTAHSPELIFHIINMSQDASVSLSVTLPLKPRGNNASMYITFDPINQQMTASSCPR